jgi:hypothetical protein
MDFELSSEFSRIQAIPHFTIFAKKSESTRLWFQETLGTKIALLYLKLRISGFQVVYHTEPRDPEFRRLCYVNVYYADSRTMYVQYNTIMSCHVMCEAAPAHHAKKTPIL